MGRKKEVKKGNGEKIEVEILSPSMIADMTVPLPGFIIDRYRINQWYREKQIIWILVLYLGILNSIISLVLVFDFSK